MASCLTKVGPTWPESRGQISVLRDGNLRVSLNYQDSPFQATGRCPRQTGSFGVGHKTIMPAHNNLPPYWAYISMFSPSNLELLYDRGLTHEQSPSYGSSCTRFFYHDVHP